MQQSRRRFLAAAGASLAIAGCQDGGAPTPVASPGGPDDIAEEQDATPVPGEDDDTDGGDAGADGNEPGDGTGTDSDATVAVRNHGEYGEILVDGEGVTLYIFQEDSQDAGESTCTGECAESWPPFVTAGDGEPGIGEGVQAEVSTFEREDGDTQVAVNGWPLYRFLQDEAPGDANGQGINDVWWVVQPNGEPLQNGGGENGTGNGDGTVDGVGAGGEGDGGGA